MTLPRELDRTGFMILVNFCGQHANPFGKAFMLVQLIIPKKL